MYSIESHPRAITLGNYNNKNNAFSEPSGKASISST